MNHESEDASFEYAKEIYEKTGVDVDAALEVLGNTSISIHCWQGDDVGGFESRECSLDGGLVVTGSYPGRARTPGELRQDLEKAFSLVPGKHRLNLHAFYGEFGADDVDRDSIEPGHFKGWMDWAGRIGIGLDFNATCFSHPNAVDGFTLSHTDMSIRSFWIEHVRRCREIAACMGKAMGSPCIHNLWIPDGSKDFTPSRRRHRSLLRESLDKIYEDKYSTEFLKDSVESKLFGIGSESYTVGSHEFYLSYALTRGIMTCLDLGHFHPTESIADKVSAVLEFMPEFLLHLSRGVRWDSDHVVVMDDSLLDVTHEIVRADAVHRVHLALDYFDATINRVGAWVIGARAVQMALLRALLEPVDLMRDMENRGRGFALLAMGEYSKSLPWGAVWERFCKDRSCPIGEDLVQAIDDYEAKVLPERV